MPITVIVPAHNEESHIGTTVASLLASAYQPPPEVLVVADNCSDSTARRAQNAGATVVERRSESERGKSFALDFAVDAIRARELPPDIVVVVDADTIVSGEFFEYIASAILNGADVVQAHYAAAPSETPMGRLRRLAFAIVHWSRPLGAARIGLPTTLKGNGMAFRWDVVRAGMPGSGITEDAAATLDLAERGIVVRFEPNATVTGLMAEHFVEARTQDLRWEGGRFRLVGPALKLMFSKIRSGDLAAAAAAAEVASPPLTVVVVGGAIAAAMGCLGLGSRRLGCASLGLTAASVVCGLVAARASRADLKGLLHAPPFVVHKLGVYVSLAANRGPREWITTRRS